MNGKKDVFGVLVGVGVADEMEEECVGGGDVVDGVVFGVGDEEHDQMDLDLEPMMDMRPQNKTFYIDDEELEDEEEEGDCLQSSNLDADHLAVMLRSMCFPGDDDAPVPDPNDLPMNCSSRLATVSL